MITLLLHFGSYGVIFAWLVLLGGSAFGWLECVPLLWGGYTCRFFLGAFAYFSFLFCCFYCYLGGLYGFV